LLALVSVDESLSFFTLFLVAVKYISFHTKNWKKKKKKKKKKKTRGRGGTVFDSSSNNPF